MNGSVGQHAGGPTDAAKENAARAAGVKRVDEREQSHATPLTLSHLWKPPVVRQYMQGDVLHKENVERKPSQFELALDLAYAGIVVRLFICQTCRLQLSFILRSTSSPKSRLKSTMDSPYAQSYKTCAQLTGNSSLAFSLLSSPVG